MMNVPISNASAILAALAIVTAAAAPSDGNVTTTASTYATYRATFVPHLFLTPADMKRFSVATTLQSDRGARML